MNIQKEDILIVIQRVKLRRYILLGAAHIHASSVLFLKLAAKSCVSIASNGS